jgi:hypothetical protein
MYFNFLPSIKYDVKPISYPFSESDYVVAKNFFRRYKISDTAFNQTVYFNKYALQDGQRLDQIAETLYGNPNYDWVVVLTNNMVNTTFDLPMSESELRKHIERLYDNPYYDYHHYEIISDDEQIEKFGKVLMPGGTWVDQTFYDGRKTLVADTFPDLSSNTETVVYRKEYVFSSGGFDNSLVVDNFNANFEGYGSGTGEDGGFVLYSPLRNGRRSDGYLRFRGAGERYAQFYQLDATNLVSFTFKGKFGNDINGGEEADLADEILKIQYRTSSTDPWTDIDVIIPLGMVQYIEWNQTPQPDLGFGGPGRPQGQYTNVALYLNESPTNALVNVTVESDGSVSAIEFVDRGEGLPFNTTDLKIRNEDIGNGFFYLDAQQTIGYLPDLVLFNVSTRQDPSGVQYGRYSNDPYVFKVDIPQEAKTSTTEFRLFQPENSGIIFDQYAIQEIIYEYSEVVTRETTLNYVAIDPDNYVIDGVRWTRENGTWYRVVQNGFRYYDNGAIKVIAGNELSRPVTEFEYEQTENEKKREIYLLKPQYVKLLVEDFRKASLYKKSSDYVSNRLKSTGV